MDLAPLAGTLGGAVAALGALAVAFREKAKRAALEAEAELEQEQQESRAQQHALERIRTLESRMDTQGELIANLQGENLLLRQKLASQDVIIGRQAKRIGSLTRANRRLTEIAREEQGRARAAAAEQAELRRLIQGSRDKPSGLPADLYEPLPLPPRLPRR
jgi:Sec-independent protein translocase protein TatA